jgi:hypothetical protein
MRKALLLLDKLVTAAQLQLKETHENILQSIVLFHARNLAEKNLPAPNDPSLKPFLTSIAAAYQSLKKDVAVKLKGGIQKAIGAVNLATCNQTIEKTELAIKTKQEDRRYLEVEKRRIHLPTDCSTFLRQQRILWCLCIGECLWAMNGFIGIGDNFFFAALLGLLVGLAQVFVTKNSILIIKEIADEQKRRLWICVTITGLLLISLVMGALRFYFVHAGVGASIPFLYINPITFTIINLLFIGATATLVFHYFPSKEDRKKIGEINKLDRKIREYTNDIQSLGNEVERLLHERELMIELRAKTIHDEEKLLEQVDTYYTQAVGHFMHENLIRRTDGKFPNAFNNSHNPLPGGDDDSFVPTAG